VFDSVHLSFEASAEGEGHGYGLSAIFELILHEIHLPCHSYLNADEELIPGTPDDRVVSLKFNWR
jgi:hypothetical protein